MFFYKQKPSMDTGPEEKKPTGFIHCIVEMPRSTPQAKEASREHSKIFTTLLRRFELDSYRFDFAQRTIISHKIVGRIWLKVEIDTQTPDPVCVLSYAGSSGGGTWRYNIRRRGMSAYEVYLVLHEQMFNGQKRIFARSLYEDTLLSLKKWWTNKKSNKKTNGQKARNLSLFSR
jgi:hypothetical protein